jgi:peptide/nickel transport system permease protein
VFFFSLPEFWLAIALLVLLTVALPIFPASGAVDPVLYDYMSPAERALDRASHLALPALTLALGALAVVARHQRAALLDAVSLDFVRAARAKGVSEPRVILRHVFRNALIPLVTVIAVNVGALLGGAIVTETVFSLDGMGFYFINKLQQLDLYAVMAWLMVTSVIVIVFNLAADVLYGYLDPRIRNA